MPPKQRIPLTLPTLISHTELASVAPELQLVRLHRRFVRLKVFLPLLKQRTTYLALLRDRFTRDYNQRHLTILGTNPQLSQDRLIQRSLNTLELLNRAFSYTEGDVSTEIVMNLIKFEQSKQMLVEKNHLDKYLAREVKDLAYYDLSTKQKSKKWDDWASIRDYDKTLLRFNETMEMAL